MPERISKLMRVSAVATLTVLSLALAAPIAMSDTSKSESESAAPAKASSEGAATPAAAEKPEEAPTQTEEAASDGALPDLAAETLEDPLKVTMGQDLWQQQCRHCHGRSAYPGKAPKLKPRKYKPEFVFDRITNGFRKMPPWKDVFSDDQRVALVAWILSKDFSP